jgi:hypothetical protein
VSLHETPWSLDWVQLWAKGPNEIQLDPAAWPGEPFPRELGMMIARVVEKDM